MKNLFLLVIALFTLSSFTKPTFQKQGDYLKVRVNNPDLSPVKFEVTTLDGSPVYSEVIEDEAQIGKLFNFKRAYPNTYVVKVKDGGKVSEIQVVVD